MLAPNQTLRFIRSMRVASCPACPNWPGTQPHLSCATAQGRDSFLLPILNRKNQVAAAVREAGRAEALGAVLAEAAAEPVAPEVGQAAELAAGAAEKAGRAE